MIRQVRWMFPLALLLHAGAADRAVPPHAVQPNLVILLADDCGYNEFSFNGGGPVPTPRIDSIARSGVRFRHAYVSSPVCSPSRAGLLTGRYQEHLGHEFNIPPVYSPVNGLPLGVPTLPGLLRDAGYRTLAFGKWHLGYAPAFHPLERGFTRFHGFLQGSRSYFPLAHPSRLNQLLEDRTPVTPESFDYMTDHLAEQAADAITANQNSPFFLYLAFNATHTPLQTKPADLEQAHGNRVHAMTLALDRAVGTVLDRLDSLHLRNNTLVVFLSDNGGPGGHDNSPLRGHKGQTWDGGIRVPFAASWPGTLPANQSCDHPVITLDLLPTFLAAAHIPTPATLHPDGINLLPQLTGQPAPPARDLFWKFGSCWAVRSGNLKLTGGNKEQSQPELFDLQQDNAESHNLAASRADDVKRLQSLYQTWAAKVKPTPWHPSSSSQADDNEDDSTKKSKSHASPSPAP